MKKTKAINGYGLINIHNRALMYKFFPYRRDAVSYAEYSISNHNNINWKDVFKIVKVELKAI